MNYLDALAVRLVGQQVQVVCGRLPEFNTILLEDGSTTTGHIWELSIDVNSGRPRIDFTQNGLQLVYVLLDSNQGYWEGKDNTSASSCMRMPSETGDWSHLRSNRDYQKYLATEDVVDPEAFSKAMSGNFGWEYHLPNAEPVIQAELLESMAAGGTTPIVLHCFNREEYFQRAVTSLAAANKLDYPLFLFADFPEDRPAYIGLQDRQVEFAKEHFKEVYAFKWPIRAGDRRNKIYAKQVVFDLFGCSRAFFFDDDVEVTPNYVRFCENLLDWSDQYTNVAGVTGWSRQLNMEGATSKTVRACYEDDYGLLQTREGYNASKFLLSQFSELWLGGNEVDNLAFGQIHQWLEFKKRGNSPGLGYGDSPYPLDTLSEAQVASVWTYDQIKEDQAFDGFASNLSDLERLGRVMEGWVILQPSISRAAYFGKNGLRENSESFERYDHVKCTNSPGDHALRNFQIQPAPALQGVHLD